MLYLTTRNKYDAYTAYNAMMSERAADGGLFVPYQLPVLTDEERVQLFSMPFGKCVAQMLNKFFSTQLTGWDVEFSVGRYPINVSNATNKVLQLELWRNLEGSYEKMERNLAAMVCGCTNHEVHLTPWLRIAIRIAVMTGAFAELFRQNLLEEGTPVDVAVASEDFSLAMAIWYCKEMGLPVGKIVCSCVEESPFWDLLNYGEARKPSDHAAAGEMERLLYCTLGVEASAAFAKTGICNLPKPMLQQLRSCFATAVVSRQRLENTVSSVYRTSGCVLEAWAAMAYGGLMDHRARTGENKPALILADRDPASELPVLAQALKLSQTELKGILERK